VAEISTGVTVTCAQCSEGAGFAASWLTPSAGSTLEIDSRPEEFLESGNTSRRAQGVTKLLVDLFGTGSDSYDGNIFIEADLSYHF
jgi:hypothetical protein